MLLCCMSEQKRAEGKQIFSKGGQAGSKEPPYELWSLHIPIMEYSEAELSLSTGLKMKMI